MKIQNKHLEEARRNFKKDLDAFSKSLSRKCSVRDVRERNCPWDNIPDLMVSVVAFGSLMIAVNIQEMSEGEL